MATLLDGQIGYAAEASTTWGTAVTVTNFLELATESLRPNYPIIPGSGFRPGARATRSDRVARPGMKGGGGTITWQPLTKGGSGLSGLLAATLGTVASTTSATDSVYTHTGTIGDLAGDSLTIQVGRPDTGGATGTASTVRPFTYAGCKATGLTLATTVDGLLEATLEIGHMASETTSTSLASASYASGAEVFDWTDGSLTLAGSAVLVSDVSFSLRNVYRERWSLGNTQREPLENGIREVTCRFTMEFEDLTEVNYIRAAVAATGQKKLVCTWSGSTLAGVSAYPQIIATIEVADLVAETYPSINGQDMIMLGFTGTARYDGTNSPLKIEVKSTDSTA